MLPRRSDGLAKLVPRTYQVELVRAIEEGNAIIYLGTGLGKTFVTVIYINSPDVSAQIRNGRKIAFLAPTQDLVLQQAEYINREVDYQVRLYSDSEKKWKPNFWLKELETVDLMFMTPDVFLYAISGNALDWSQFAAVIFDEFHHSCESKRPNSTGSAYRNILASYGSTRGSKHRPRLIGLTASLINSKITSPQSLFKQVNELETLIDGKCITVSDVSESKPTMIMYTYIPSHYTDESDLISKILTELFNVTSAALAKALAEKSKDKKKASHDDRLKLAAAGLSIRPEDFPKMITDLKMIRQDCGLWPLSIICSRVYAALEKTPLLVFKSSNIQEMYNKFCHIIGLIDRCLKNYFRPLHAMDYLIEYSEPKFKCLLSALKEEYERKLNQADAKETFSCIVFVRSRLVVMALSEWLQHISVLPKYNFIKCEYAVGLVGQTTTSACLTKRNAARQAEILNQFRAGDLNVIVTTPVLEEGIDLPVCSTVIRYDRPHTLREYVQSRGRARQKFSSFVVVCEESEATKIQSELNVFHESEMIIKDFITDKDIRCRMEKQGNFSMPMEIDGRNEVDTFVAKDGKIRVNPTFARFIILRYSHHWARNVPFSDGIRYETKRPTADTRQTTLYLPSGCPLSNGIPGRIKSSTKEAVGSAFVAAVRALYEIEELDQDHPYKINTKKFDQLLKERNLEPKIQPLDSNLLNGVPNGGATQFNFVPRARILNNSLLRDIDKRNYILYRLRFMGADHAVRRDTRPLMEQPVLGIIIDSKCSTSFIPEFIHSHYGKYEVRAEKLPGSTSMNDPQFHENCFNYTFNIPMAYWCLANLEKENFRQHCLYYLVPLNRDGSINAKRVVESLANSKRPISVGNVVKLSSEFQDEISKDMFFIVLSINYDMDARSQVPEMKKQVTFLEYAELKYGPGCVTNPDQPVVRVMPIARKFAQIKESTTIDEDYTSTSIYYLHQFLEFFDDDVHTAIQSFNLPEMIFRLYEHTSVAELDRRLVSSDSSEVHLQPQAGCARNLRADDGDDPDDDSDQDSEIDLECEVGGVDPSNEQQLEEDLIDFSSPDSFFMDTKTDSNVGEQTQTCPKVPRGLQFISQPVRRYDSTGHTHDDRLISALTRLSDDIGPVHSQLVDCLRKYQRRSLSDDIDQLDGPSVGEIATFSKRMARVDRTLKSPVCFDDAGTPYKHAPSREVGLDEALTLKRAGRTYNLECLENVGDSFLKYLVSVVVYQAITDGEGLLTSIRSRLTSNRYFHYLARQIQLGTYAMDRPFSKDRFCYLLGGGVAPDRGEVSVNRLRRKDLADLFESVLGSYLIYHGQYQAILALKSLGLNILCRDTFQELGPERIVFAVETITGANYNHHDLMSHYSKIRTFEEILDYKFKEPAFLVQALTHASLQMKITRSYERLEFLGDALLDYLTTMTLYNSGSFTTPGQITASRSALVNNYAFAKLALTYKFDLYILHHSLAVHQELVRVHARMDDDPEMECLDMVDFDAIVKLLGDLFEAVAGAIYLDSGCSLDTLWSIYYPMMKCNIENELHNPSKNLFSLLYEKFPGRVKFATDKALSDRGDNVVCFRYTIENFDNQGARVFEGRGARRSQAKRRAVKMVMDSVNSETLLAK